MEHTQLYKDIHAKGEKKGKKEGKKEGKEEGKKEGVKNVLLVQMRAALGEDADLEAALMSASDATRLEVAMALVTESDEEAKGNQVRALLLPGIAERSTRANGAPRGPRRQRSSPRRGGRG